MARPRIGPERLSLSDSNRRCGASLDEISALIDWAQIHNTSAGIYAAAKGELGWPPLALFRAMLLAIWYDLSDEALDDRVSFRRFCGFAIPCGTGQPCCSPIPGLGT